MNIGRAEEDGVAFILIPSLSRQAKTPINALGKGPAAFATARRFVSPAM